MSCILGRRASVPRTIVCLAVLASHALSGCSSDDSYVEVKENPAGADGGASVFTGRPFTGKPCTTDCAKSCQQALLDRGIDFTPAENPLESPEGHPELVCDVDDPIWLAPVLRGVTYRPGGVTAAPEPLFVTCPLALSLERASEILSERGATDLLHFGTYNCRFIAGTNQISEHGFARAIDIAGIGLGTGDVYTVLTDWEKDTPNPITAAGAFLKELVQTYYDEQVFNIIITPDYNADHEDHFHCDLTPGAHDIK